MSGLTWRGWKRFTVRPVRHRQTKETDTDRLHLRDTASVLDPTRLKAFRTKLLGSEFLYGALSGPSFD
jgi:hypothetical protein